FDRWRPSTPSMKLFALLWGACAATFFAIIINSWMSTLLAGSPSGPDMAGNAAAVFVAPFVEEACKATVLFLLVMAMRRRMCSVLQMIGLSGLAAAGFAFTENIIYYVRLYCEASLTPGIDATAYLHQMVLLRGVYTSFGHPLFTMMTAFGLIIGLRQRSKLVRIICPLTGYLVAALLHMCFNGLASFLDDYTVLVRMGVMVIIFVIVWLFGQFMAQRRIIAWRLDDYVRMGWLRDRDPVVYSAAMTRLKLTVAGWLRGWRIGKATVRLMSDVTELAYLRHGLVTGTVDAGVVGREHELVVDAKALRGIAIDEVVGLRVVPRYRGPAAWHTFKAWRARRARQVVAAPWGAPTSSWGAPIRV
ncbi:MAG: PrsW family intramembrane metalloprotease, partial [Propionibacteriaceae bacterium]|nr:PrsW family intramembrane metalloprotease [Propionibacteriaceae bacterium]